MSLESSKSLPSLIISRASLTALETLRTEANIPSRERAIETIVLAAGKPSQKGKKGSFEYVQNRLLNGISVSKGHVRFNYTLALTALIRHAESVGVTAAAAAALYTDPKAFDMSHASLSRERALGALAAASALTAVASPGLALYTARDILRVARVTMESCTAPCRLSLPAVLVIHRLLQKTSPSSRDALVKPIWAICSQHPATEHAIALVFILLLEMELAKPSSVHALYPNLEGHFSTALLSTFNSGFSLFDTALVGSHEEHLSSSIVPISWKLAIKYISAPPEVKMMKVDLLSFWRGIVQKSVMTSEKSVEKRIFVIQLLPDVADDIHDIELFGAIFDEKLAFFIDSLTELKRPSNRLSMSASERISACLETYTQRLLDSITNSTRSNEERSLLINGYWVWVVKHDLTHLLLPGERLSTILSELGTNEVTALMKIMLQEFSSPGKDRAAGKGGLKKALNSSRLYIAKFLLSCADIHHFVANDIVRALALFCIFQNAQLSAQTFQTPWVKFDVCQCDSRDFCGCLPKPNPAISVDTARAVFRRLADYLTTAGHKEGSNKLVNTCFETICAGIVKNPSSLTGSISNELKLSLNKRVVSLLESLNQRKPAGELKAVFAALQDMLLFLGVDVMEPYVKKGGKSNDGHSDPHTHINEEYGVLLDRLEEFINDALTSETKDNHDKDDVEPEPIEKVSLLICELCGRPGTRFRQIALRAIERLAPFVDDRVVAVLFDAMDMYRSGVETLSGAMVEDPDEMSEKSDEAEESDSEDDEHETSSSEGIEDGDEGAEGDGKEEQGTDTTTAMNNSKDEESEDSDTDMDVNVDIDDEDPQVLAELDKRLSLHVKLIKEERKEKKQEIKGSGLWRVRRVLHMVEVVVRMLRLRLEREGHSGNEHPSDARIGLVFLDTLVRLYDFVFSDVADNLLVMDQVTDIVTKQMCVVSVPMLSSKITDVQTMVETVDHFFEILLRRKHSKVLDKDNVRTISKAASLLMSIAVNLSDKINFSTFYASFEKMAENILSKDGSICSMEVLSSFIHLAGDEALKLIIPITRAFDNGLEKQGRLNASILILSLATSLKSRLSSCDAPPDKAVEVFWKNLASIVLKHFTIESNRVKWTRASASNIVRAVALGLTEEVSFQERDILRAHVGSVLQSMRLENSERSHLCRLIGFKKS